MPGVRTARQRKTTPDLHSKFTGDSPPVNLLLTCRRQIRAMAQRSVSLIHESDLPSIGPSRQDANRVARVPKSSISTVLSRRFTSYAWAQNRDKKLISKRQVAKLFSVSMQTIDCWLHDGKLPEPKRTFPRQKWDYEELVARTRLKSRLYR